MKVLTPHSNLPKSSRGVALVLVLVLLVLMTGLIVAFFSSVTAEHSSAKTYADGVSTRQLADSAVNIVTGVLREATSTPGSAWASQAGMIRVFDENGKPESYYKLYSSDTQKVFQTQIEAGYKLSDDLSVTWDQTPALFTDLNSPIMTMDSAGVMRPHFPILDPRAMDNGVEGFSYTAGVDGADPALTGDNRRLPMPVKWVYVLKDGTLTPPTTGDSVSARWDSSKVAAAKLPTKDNPIVGRIAFWTDDESCKVNINTASEGTYWDAPIAYSQPPDSKTGAKTASPIGTGDWQLAEFQGAQKEFQRYPGHPATTSLSAVFGKNLVDSSGNPMTRSQLVKTVTDLIPRVTDSPTASGGMPGSSMGGTQAVPTPTSGTSQSGIKVDADRLYASLDEFVFDPSRREQSLGSNFRSTVETARFFLTANSRAPEENLFGKPRVAIWPITKSNVNSLTDQSKMTTFDKLIAHASTIPGDVNNPAVVKNYYFARQDPKSQTVDWSTRNREIYSYLQALTGQKIPGFGGNFLAKYPVPSGAPASERDQILTQIFDYVRCTNMVDASEGIAKAYTDPTQSADFATNRGWVVPIKPPTGSPGANTRGFGRIATISELALICIAVKPTNGMVNGVPVNENTHTMIEVNLVPELFCPMAGFSALSENMRIRFTDIKLTIAGVANAFGSGSYPEIKSTSSDTGRISNDTNHVFKIGGSMGIGTLTEPTFGGSIATPADSVYPSAEVLVTGTGAAGGKFWIQGGTVKAEIISPANSNNVIQTFTFKIPNEEAPIPRYAPQDTTKQPAREYAKGGTGSKIKGPRLLEQYFRGMILGEDTVRTVAPRGGAGKGIQGDYRLIAARATVDKIGGQDAFLGVKPNSGAKYHGIQGSYRVGKGANFAFAGFEADPLVQGVSYTSGGGRALNPDVPRWNNSSNLEAINGVRNYLGQPGDWDNGSGLMPDGAYLNKADEGTTRLEADGRTTALSYIQDWRGTQSMVQNTTFFSPNRQVPSPMMLGSLPTGVLAGRPWQTLHFRPKNLIPNGAGTVYSHPGAGDFTNPASPKVPDHLLLDLFWMPVVEPYAISEPFSTAGKINLNYQIAPFTYIKRDTGLRAVLRSTMITALNPMDPDGWAYIHPQGHRRFSEHYKFDVDGLPQAMTRRAINPEETLKQFESRFARQSHTPADPNFFVSPSEICDVYLVPQVSGVTAANINTTFWRNHTLTGDNSLEKPYSHIYPRITTKSNTYTVHVRVQSLKKVTTDPNQAIWNENRDQTLGEYRGSFIVERYLDPATAGFYKDGNVAEPTTETDPNGILGPYRYRVVSSKQFGQ